MKTTWEITHIDRGFYSSSAAFLGEKLDWRPVDLPCSVQNSPFGLPLDELYRHNRVSEVEWMRDQVWLYRTQIPAVSIGVEEDAVYQFLGIDYACDIFLNDQKFLSHEGMFSIVEIPLSGVQEGDLLTVAILPFAENPVLPENSKARMTVGNGWDFAPKILSAGIWDDAEIVIHKKLRVSRAHVKTKLANSQRADVWVNIHLSEPVEMGLAKVEVDGVSRACPIVNTNHLSVPINLHSPRLWWPNGMGKPTLVDLKITLEVPGRAADVFQQKVGLRSIERIPCEGQGQEDIPLQLVVNGQRVFLQGANWVPLDSCIGSSSTERYRIFLDQFHAAGINFLRVWGGGLKEKDGFYTLCDELGLLVMQEFPLACQKIARTEQFYRILAQEVAAIIQRLCSHPSVVWWSGGNEHYHYWDAVDSGTAHMDAIREQVKQMFDLVSTETDNPEWRGGCPKYEEPALTLMGSLCDQHDGSRPYQITSAMEGEGEAHGIWNWNPTIGDHRFRDYDTLYDYWRNAKGHLFSECSVSSIANLETIQFVIGEEQPGLPTTQDPIWKLHNAFHSAWDGLPDLWLDIPSTERLFGKLEDLRSLIAANQWMQGEGGRFLIEEIKRRIEFTSGIVWWGVNEPWPSLAGNALIDYFGRQKASWKMITNAMKPVALSLRYEHCVVRRLKPELWISNILPDSFSGSYQIDVTNLTSGKVDHYQGNVNCEGYHSSYVKTLIPVRMNAGTHVRIDCKLNSAVGEQPIHMNTYWFGSNEEEAPLRWLLEN